jgi:hypothetical protein
MEFNSKKSAVVMNLEYRNIMLKKEWKSFEENILVRNRISESSPWEQ